MTRVVNSVPGMRTAVQMPYSYLRHIPGVDVAAGVTMYQLAASTRAASATAGRGRASATDVARSVSNAVGRVTEEMDELGGAASEIALHAARGSVNALNDAGIEDVSAVARGAMVGTVRAVGSAATNPLRALRGAARGVIRGAYEADASLADVAIQSVEGARDTAGEIGVAEEYAVRHVIDSVLAEAETLGSVELREVQQALQPVVTALGPEPDPPAGS